MVAGVTTKKLALNELTLDGECQPREVLNMGTVESLVAEIEQGTLLEPADVFYEKASGKNWFAHGWHRREAHARAGLDEMMCSIHAGTRDDAIWFAAGRNLKGQTPRTRGDRKKAVMMALATKVAKGMSDKRIADYCGVSKSYVTKLRNPPKQDGEAVTSHRLAVQEGGGVDVQASPFTRAGLGGGQQAAESQTEEPQTDVTVIEDNGEVEPPERKPAPAQSEGEPEPPERPPTAAETKEKARKAWDNTIAGFAILGIFDACNDDFAELTKHTGRRRKPEIKKQTKADLGRLQRGVEILVKDYSKVSDIFERLYEALGKA